MSYHNLFVNSIVKNPIGGVTVEASNGNPEGPPFVRFEIPNDRGDIIRNLTIGSKVKMTLEVGD